MNEAYNMEQQSTVHSYNALFSAILKQNIALNGEKGIAGFSLFNGPTGLGKTSSLYSAHDDPQAIPILQEIRNAGKKAIFLTHRWNILLDLYHNLTPKETTGSPIEAEQKSQFKATLLYPQKQLFTAVICDIPLPHEKSAHNTEPNNSLTSEHLHQARDKAQRNLQQLVKENAISKDLYQKWLHYCYQIIHNYESLPDKTQVNPDKEQKLLDACKKFEHSLIRTLQESDEETQKILRSHPFIQQLLPAIRFQDESHDLLMMTTQKFFYGFFDGKIKQRFSQPSLRDYVIFIDEFDYQADELQKLLAIDFPIQNMMECIGQLLVDSKAILERSKPYHPEACEKLIQLSEQFAQSLQKANLPELQYQHRTLLTPEYLTEQETPFETRYLFRADQLISNAHLSLVRENDFLVLYPQKEHIPAGAESIPLYQFMRILEQYLSQFIRELHYIDEYFEKDDPHPVSLSRRILNDLLNEKNDGKESYYAKVLPYLYPFLQIKTNLAELSEISDTGKIPKTYENISGFVTWAISSNDEAFDKRKLKVKRAAMQTTPEGILLDLTSRNLVIGLSATAYIPRVLFNFDLPWLMQVLPYIAHLRTPGLNYDSFGSAIDAKKKEEYINSPIPYFDTEAMMDLQKSLIQYLIIKKKHLRQSCGTLHITDFNGRFNEDLHQRIATKSNHSTAYQHAKLFPDLIPEPSKIFEQDAHLQSESLFYHHLPSDIWNEYNQYSLVFDELEDEILSPRKRGRINSKQQYQQIRFSKQLEILKIASYKQDHIGQIAFCNSFKQFHQWLQHPNRHKSQQYLPWLKIFSLKESKSFNQYSSYDVSKNSDKVRPFTKENPTPDLLQDITQASLQKSDENITDQIQPSHTEAYQRWHHVITELKLINRGSYTHPLSPYLYYLEVNGRPLILWLLNAQSQKLSNFSHYYQRLFQCQIPILLLTQRESSSNGINFHFDNHLNKKEDLSIIYLLEERHYFFSKKQSTVTKIEDPSYEDYDSLLYNANNDPNVDMIRNLYKLQQNRLLSKTELTQNIAQILSGYPLDELNSNYKKNEDYLLNIMADLQQQIGRLERVWDFSKNIEIYATPELTRRIAQFADSYTYQNNQKLISQLNLELIEQSVIYDRKYKIASDIETITTTTQSGDKIIEIIESFLVPLLQEVRDSEDLTELFIVQKIWQKLGQAVMKQDYHWSIQDESIHYQGNHPNIQKLLIILQQPLYQWACFKLPSISKHDEKNSGPSIAISTKASLLVAHLQKIWYTTAPWKFFTMPGEQRRRYDLDRIYNVISRHHKILFQFRSQNFLTTLLPIQMLQYEYALHPHIVQRILKGRAGEYALKALFTHYLIKSSFDSVSPKTYETYDLNIVGTDYRVDAKFWSSTYMNKINKEYFQYNDLQESNQEQEHPSLTGSQKQKQTKTPYNLGINYGIDSALDASIIAHSTEDIHHDEMYGYGDYEDDFTEDDYSVTQQNTLEISGVNSTSPLFPEKIIQKLKRIRQYEGESTKLVIINLFDPNRPGKLLGYNAQFEPIESILKADILLLNSALHHIEIEQCSPGFEQFIELIQRQLPSLASDTQRDHSLEDEIPSHHNTLVDNGITQEDRNEQD